MENNMKAVRKPIIFTVGEKKNNNKKTYWTNIEMRAY